MMSSVELETSNKPGSVVASEIRRTIVVIGNGMVGLRFCEKLVRFDASRQYRIVTFCEEPRTAYDRVGLTSFFAHRDAEKLMLARMDWYAANGVELHIGDRACDIDRENRIVRSQKGQEIRYDEVVIATGSFPFVPPIPGVEKKGVFVYRTIEDLEHIISFSNKSKRCAVIGGGLLGLEAAKAALDLGLETHVIESNGRLMPRQVDDAGSRILVQKIEQLGVAVHLNKGTKEIHGEHHVERIEFTDGEVLDVDMIIVSTGIRPRDELAREAEIEVGDEGGIRVNDRLQTSDPDIYAIGECALHGGMVYGLVAPGYQMAETVATNLTGGEMRFSGTDLSTKLKLMGVDVASFGEYELGPDKAVSLSFEDPIAGFYKKLVFSLDGKRLKGGILVGDASEYAILRTISRSDEDLPCEPRDLLVGARNAAASIGGADAMSDQPQVSSSNDVTKGAIREQGFASVGAVESCTNAGARCGDCPPLATDPFNSEMKRAGHFMTDNLCEHFPGSRTELFAGIRTKQLTSFTEVLRECGLGSGCEVCEPAIASILASLWNETNVDDQQHVGLAENAS
jgi:NAD(P)H-dependent nitrite reductase large subunit